MSSGELARSQLEQDQLSGEWSGFEARESLKRVDSTDLNYIRPSVLLTIGPQKARH